MFRCGIDHGRIAYNEAQLADYMPYVPYPYDDVSFARLTTADYRSALRLQPEGMSVALFVCRTGISSHAGLIVFIATPKDPECDLNLTTSFSQPYNSMDANNELYNYQMLRMVPGDML